MKVVRIQYLIAFYHILSFREIYKKIISPFFLQPNLSYQIDNEYSQEESIRLIFNDYDTVIQCRKDGMTIAFQGNEKDFTSSSSNIKEFFSILDAFKSHESFTKITFHEAQFMIYDKTPIIADKYLKYIPKSKNIKEFACNYVYEKDEYLSNLWFGNFIVEDIKKLNLIIFQNEITEELSKEVEGTLIDLKTKELTSNPSLNKLKNLINFAISEAKKV